MSPKFAHCPVARGGGLRRWDALMSQLKHRARGLSTPCLVERHPGGSVVEWRTRTARAICPAIPSGRELPSGCRSQPPRFAARIVRPGSLPAPGLMTAQALYSTVSRLAAAQEFPEPASPADARSRHWRTEQSNTSASFQKIQQPRRERVKTRPVPRRRLRRPYRLSSPEGPWRRRRLERVLWNDPATGVMRHADAGYETAIECAKEKGLNLPSL
mgnify:CR=1 FL=1